MLFTLLPLEKRQTYPALNFSSKFITNQSQGVRNYVNHPKEVHANSLEIRMYSSFLAYSMLIVIRWPIMVVGHEMDLWNNDYLSGQRVGKVYVYQVYPQGVKEGTWHQTVMCFTSFVLPKIPLFSFRLSPLVRQKHTRTDCVFWPTIIGNVYRDLQKEQNASLLCFVSAIFSQESSTTNASRSQSHIPRKDFKSQTHRGIFFCHIDCHLQLFDWR